MIKNRLAVELVMPVALGICRGYWLFLWPRESGRPVQLVQWIVSHVS